VNLKVVIVTLPVRLLAIHDELSMSSRQKTVVPGKGLTLKNPGTKGAFVGALESDDEDDRK